MSAHAPAPWKVDTKDERHPGAYLSLRDADGKAVAIVYGATLEQRSVNARMLEAAPEMLAALQGALNWLASYPGGGSDNAYGAARAAKAKAEGGPS